MNKSSTRILALAAASLLIPACGGGGGGGGTSASGLVSYLTSGGSVQSITSTGGSAGNGAGGAGGAVVIDGINGSPIQVLKTDGVNASFEMPAGPLDLGSNPLTVSTAEAITYSGTDGNLTVAIDGLFFGNDGATPATGLWIQSGGSLTLAPDDGAVNVTVAPLTGLPPLSTVTARSVANAVPTVAVCGVVPRFAVMVVPAAALLVRLKSAGVPTPPTVPVTV